MRITPFLTFPLGELENIHVILLGLSFNAYSYSRINWQDVSDVFIGQSRPHLVGNVQQSHVSCCRIAFSMILIGLGNSFAGVVNHYLGYRSAVYKLTIICQYIRYAVVEMS